jgi:hypothetical protein
MHKTKYCDMQNCIQLENCEYKKCITGKTALGEGCCITFQTKTMSRWKEMGS